MPLVALLKAPSCRRGLHPQRVSPHVGLGDGKLRIVGGDIDGERRGQS